MLGDDTSAKRRLLQITEIDKPYNSGMGSAECDCELTKILVERYQHLAVLLRIGRIFAIARIGAPVPDPLCFVPGAFEFQLRAWPDAAIKQELQAASLVMAGSMRS